jgi:GT2 family glycosyltransferase
VTAAITIHFKEPCLTQGCIESLLADGWAPVLVWDNSEDGGVSLQALQAQFATDARVHWVESPANVGFGQGMNGALAALGAHGPVLLINNDTRVRSGMHVALHAELAGAASTELIAPRIVQDGEEQGWLYYQPWLALVTRHPLPGSFAYLSGCCLLVNRPDNSQPLFDETFFMYGEDVELSWRIRRQGGRLALLDRAWLHHVGSASTGQASDSYERFLVHSHCLLAEKLATHAVSRMLMRSLRLPSLFARACVRSLRFRSLVPLRALSSLFR